MSQAVGAQPIDRAHIVEGRKAPATVGQDPGEGLDIVCAHRPALRRDGRRPRRRRCCNRRWSASSGLPARGRCPARPPRRHGQDRRAARPAPGRCRHRRRPCPRWRPAWRHCRARCGSRRGGWRAQPSGVGLRARVSLRPKRPRQEEGMRIEPPPSGHARAPPVRRQPHSAGLARVWGIPLGWRARYDHTDPILQAVGVGLEADPHPGETLAQPEGGDRGQGRPTQDVA